MPNPTVDDLRTWAIRAFLNDMGDVPLAELCQAMRLDGPVQTALVKEQLQALRLAHPGSTELALISEFLSTVTESELGGEQCAAILWNVFDVQLDVRTAGMQEHYVRTG